jgi:hypothetical protein
VTTLFAIALLLVTPLASADAPRTGAWRAARFGMTPEEVLAAFPKEAFRLSPEVTLADGKVVAVGIDGYAFEGLPFDVRFVFADGKLAMVSLRTPAKVPADAAAYARLREALERKWGPPMEDDKDDKVVDMRQTRWNRGPDRADLKYIPGVVVLIHYPRPQG